MKFLLGNSVEKQCERREVRQCVDNFFINRIALSTWKIMVFVDKPNFDTFLLHISVSKFHEFIIAIFMRI